jgi:hypothetical protein
LAQDPVASTGSDLRTGGSLADAWNATFIGRYVKSHHIGRTALVAAALGVAVLFFAIGAALRLLVGPISLSPFSSQISDALAQALPGITIKYDQAAVEWSRDQGRVNLVVLGAQVLDSQGRIIAQAPQADIDLAAQPFIQGKIVVTRVTLVGVQLTMVRTSDGTLRLGVAQGEGQADIVQRITDAINKNSSSASSLQAFAIRDARVAFKDENTGLFLISPRAAVRIAQQDQNLVATLEADVEVTGEAAHVSGEMILPPREGPVRGSIQVTHLDIAALGHNAKMFAFLQSVAMIADFNASFAIEGAHLLNAQFGVGARGTAVLVGIRKPVQVKTLRLMGRYDRATSRISVDDATLDSDQLQAHIVGRGDLFSDRSGAIERIGVDLTADKTALSVPGAFAQPVFLPLINLRGSYIPATHDILIDRLTTSGGALQLDTSGKITLVDNKSPVLDIRGRMAPMSVRDLLHYWPLGIGEGARDWIDRNLFSGSLGPIVFETHLPAGALDQATVPDGALLMTFPITNAEANYVTGLTHLTGIAGTARLTGNSFSADFSRARIGPLLVSRGRAVIPDLSAPGSPGDISAHVDGSMSDILRLTDRKPLGYPTRFGIDPDQTTGKAGVDMKFHVPMRKNLSVDDVKIGIKATVSGFGMLVGRDIRLTDGAVTFEIDNNRLHAYGVSNIATSRLNVDWTEEFRASSAPTTRVLVKGPLDEAGRAMLGIHLGSYLKGPVGVSGTLSGRRGQFTAADLSLDLTAAALSLDLVGISKPAGFPSSAHANVVFGSHSAIQVETMTITGPSLTATMTMNFDPNGTLVMLNAPSVRSGMANDFSFTMQRSPSGVDIAIRGRSLDGTQLARRGSNAGRNGPSRATPTFDEPFHINARLDRVALRNGVSVAPFALDVTGVNDRPATMTLSGNTGKAGTIAGSIVPSGNDRRLTLTASDAGTLARGLFGFGSMRNGKLNLQATLHGPATSTGGGSANDYEGTIKLEDFRLLNQPFLARLFSAGSLIGFTNLLAGGGIAVDELKIPFSANNGVFGIHDARATGPAIGISADGYLDRPKNEIALKGTLVPLFGINSVLGIIPGLGNLLVSRPGEGIIGLVYTVSGDADEPKVSINPLSLAFPGITRRIWEGKMPEVSAAPSNNQPPAPDTPGPKSDVSKP